MHDLLSIQLFPGLVSQEGEKNPITCFLQPVFRIRERPGQFRKFRPSRPRRNFLRAGSGRWAGRRRRSVCRLRAARSHPRAALVSLGSAARPGQRRPAPRPAGGLLALPLPLLAARRGGLLGPRAARRRRRGAGRRPGRGGKKERAGRGAAPGPAPALGGPQRLPFRGDEAVLIAGFPRLLLKTISIVTRSSAQDLRISAACRLHQSGNARISSSPRQSAALLQTSLWTIAQPHAARGVFATALLPRCLPRVSSPLPQTHKHLT